MALIGIDSDNKRMAAAVAASRALVAALADPSLHGPGCREVRVLETHISWVLLTGTTAWKIKKPLTLGFLDFGTLAQRRRCCEDELRLNRRLAPRLYLAVVPITGSPDAPVLGGDGAVIEWAVKMCEFPQDALLSRALARGEVGARDVDELADAVAAFHARIDVADGDGGYGTPAGIQRYALENFTAIRTLPEARADAARLDTLAAWTRAQHAALAEVFEARRRGGFVRECHGDLHLGNMARVDGRLVIFDCLEFNSELRWIDVMSEAAFAVMDLEDRGRPDLARRFLNRYLEIGGDYAGVVVLRYYLAYRALVRAKVAALRAGQLAEGAAKAAALAEYRAYLALAAAQTAPVRSALWISHGLAGSGKTTLTQALLEAGEVIRLRSDVERKRLHGLDALARGDGAVDAGMYDPTSTRATYLHLRELACSLMEAGFAVLVDATCLARWQRVLFAALAARLGVPFAILVLAVPADVLRRRVAERMRRGGDASDADVAVLERQLRAQEALADDEQPWVLHCDATTPADAATAATLWEQLMRRPAPTARARPHAAAAPPPDAAATVAYLSQPAAYPHDCDRVDTVETPTSWVFLAGDAAYKLRKPVRMPWLDCSSVTARQQDGLAAVRLNRRLSHGVYLGVVPLTREAAGAGFALSLSGEGPVVDWLVRMRRLPEGRMLDRAMRAGAVDAARLRPVIAALVAHYRQAGVAGLTGEDYVALLAARLEADGRRFAAQPARLPAAAVAALIHRQQTWLTQHVALLAARAASGWVVDGHGDLRPAHICLGDPPQIIGCPASSHTQRIQDSAGEVGFLALECERLGAVRTGALLLDLYRELAGDDAPPALIHFYQSRHATTLAGLALTGRPAAEAAAPGAAHARAYWALAQAHADAAAQGAR